MAALAIVLVETAHPGNLGAVARVMANFGLDDLRLVSPAARPDDPAALANATHGLGVLTAARRFDDLPAALADRSGAWATTALRRDRPLPVVGPREAATMWWATPAPALVLGPERTGLRDEHLACCDRIVTVPTREARALNLAQSAAILCWEWSAAAGAEPPSGRGAALRADVDAFVDRLFAVAEAGGMWSEPTLRPRAQANLRAALRRAGFSTADLRALEGVVAAVGRAGGKARG